MLFGKYQFSSCFTDNASLPYYKGSTFRGVFGRALKKVVCALKIEVILGTIPFDYPPNIEEIDLTCEGIEGG